MPRQTYETSLREALARYRPSRAYLFGSRAHGKADEWSDIDLLLVKETPQPFLERLKEFALLLPKELPRVDAFIYTPKEFEAMKARENPIVMRALREGTVLYAASN